MTEPFKKAGWNRTVEFDGSRVVFSSVGENGPIRTEAGIEHVGKVDFEAAKGFRPGVLRLRVPGLVAENPAQDQHSVIFSKRKARPFEELRDMIQAIIDARPEPLYSADELKPGAVEAAPNPARQDIADAVERMGVTFGVGRLVNELPSSLRDGEEVRQLTNGSNGDGPALVVLTSQRVLVMSKAKMLFTRNESFELGNITHVEFKSGVGSGKIWIHSAGRKKLEVKRVYRQDADRIIKAVQGGAQTVHSSASPAPELGTEDRLLKLKQLHEAGVLDDEQYAEKSAPLIAQL